MSKNETGNYQPIYATAFQSARKKSDDELKQLVSQAKDYVSHVRDVKKGLRKLEAAIELACK